MFIVNYFNFIDINTLELKQKNKILIFNVDLAVYVLILIVFFYLIIILNGVENTK